MKSGHSPFHSPELLTVTGREEPMGAEPPERGGKIRVPAGEREVALGPVSAEDTWSFSATGQWKTGFVWCGPDGYRNFLFDALKFKPRVAGEARLKLMGKFRGDPDSEAFPIGAGCTKTFNRSGELVVFANDRPDGYADNRGEVTLTAARGGVAPGPTTRSRRLRRLVAQYRRRSIIAPPACRSSPPSPSASRGSFSSCRRGATSSAASARTDWAAWRSPS